MSNMDFQYDSLPIQLLIAGACYDANEGHMLVDRFRGCALNPVDCSGGDIYHHSDWLLLNDASRHDECSKQESIQLLKGSIGRCDSSSERYICTSHKSNCRSGLLFETKDEDCLVAYDTRTELVNFDLTHYGGCDYTSDAGTVGFCVWQATECPTKYTNVNADPFWAGQLPECTCERVLTGACVSQNNPSDFFCAVTPEVCDSSQDYMTGSELAESKEVTCRLCSDTMVSRPRPAGSMGQRSGGNDSGIAASLVTFTGLIVGVTVGVVLSLACITFCFCKRKKRMASNGVEQDAKMDDDEAPSETPELT